MGRQEGVVRLGENVHQGIADADDVEGLCSHENRKSLKSWCLGMRSRRARPAAAVRAARLGKMGRACLARLRAAMKIARRPLATRPLLAAQGRRGKPAAACRFAPGRLTHSLMLKALSRAFSTALPPAFRRVFKPYLPHP